MKKKFICLFLLLSCLILSPLPYSNVKADPDWLSGWYYRKSHNITGSAGAGANYTMGIKVYYGSGTDGTETIGGTIYGKIYCNSKCEADFGDIRFTDDDGSTELDYWIEEKTDSDYAITWVKVADDLDSNQTIYIYYGKSGETTTSNGDNTFPFFDDFETDLTKWTEIGSGALSQVVSPVKKGTYSMQILDNTGATPEGGYATFTGRTKYAIHYYARRVGVNEHSYYMLMMEDATIGIDMAFGGVHPTSDRIMYYSGGWNDIQEYAANTWYDFEYHIDTTNSDNFSLWIDDISKVSSGGFWNPLTAINRVQFYWGTADVGTGYVDHLFVRKWVDPEPAHGDWGSEVPFDTSPPTFSEINYDQNITNRATNFSCLITDSQTNISHAIFSWNSSGSWVNRTAFDLGDDSSSEMYNRTEILPHAGFSLGFRFYANDTFNNWNMSSITAFTVILEVTFLYNSTRGSLRVNGTDVANGTTTTYLNNTWFELTAIVYNSSFSFLNFTWFFNSTADSGNSLSNPYNLTLINKNHELWANFGHMRAAERGEYIAVGIAVSLIFIPILILIVWAIRRRRS